MNAKQGNVLLKPRSLWEVFEQGRAETGAGHCPEWVGSDCPGVLERGFEGRLSSTYGGICPRVPKRR